MLSKEKIICAISKNINLLSRYGQGYKLDVSGYKFYIGVKFVTIWEEEIIKKKTWYRDEEKIQKIVHLDPTYYIQYGVNDSIMIDITKEDWDKIEAAYLEITNKAYEDVILKLCGDEEKE